VELALLDRELNQSLVVVLRFNPRSVKNTTSILASRFPVDGLAYLRNIAGFNPLSLTIVDDQLFIGHSTFPGLWVFPMKQIETEFAKQRETLLAEQRQEKERNQKRRDQIQIAWEKYDANHDGVLNSEEKELALADPDFIEAELDRIDANHNGRLDLDELNYFDANNNLTLEPSESAAIDTAIHLLSVQVMDKLDVLRLGFLDMDAYVQIDESLRNSSWVWVDRMLDLNHDANISASEIEHYYRYLLKNVTQQEISHLATGAHSVVDWGSRDLRFMIEAYWKARQESQAPKP
jgi:Ca2+-binding EF-hand superfamily protein